MRLDARSSGRPRQPISRELDESHAGGASTVNLARQERGDLSGLVAPSVTCSAVCQLAFDSAIATARGRLSSSRGPSPDAHVASRCSLALSDCFDDRVRAAITSSQLAASSLYGPRHRVEPLRRLLELEDRGRAVRFHEMDDADVDFVDGVSRVDGGSYEPPSCGSRSATAWSPRCSSTTASAGQELLHRLGFAG